MLCLAATACADVTVESDLAYDERFTSTRLDVHAPPVSDVPRPAVIVVHGGGWAAGVGGERNVMAPHADRLAAAGFVAFNLSYRLTRQDGDEEGVFPRPVQDVICALAWVRVHADEFNVDPDRIASYGYSAGGHLASLLGVATAGDAVAPDCAAASEAPNVDGVQPVRAVMSGAGVQDMRELPAVRQVTDFLGGDCDEVPDVCVAASPIEYVEPGAPPFLFIHGNEDLFVGFDHSKRMREALRAVGTEARLLEVPGGGHLSNQTAAGDVWDLGLSIDTPAAWQATIDFFDHTIGPVP